MGCEVTLLIPALHLEGIERALDVSFWIFVEPDVLGLAWRELEGVGIHVHNHWLHVNYCRVVKLVGLSLHELGMLDRERGLLDHLGNLFGHWLLLSSLFLLRKLHMKLFSESPSIHEIKAPELLL